MQLLHGHLPCDPLSEIISKRSSQRISQSAQASNQPLTTMSVPLAASWLDDHAGVLLTKTTFSNAASTTISESSGLQGGHAAIDISSAAVCCGRWKSSSVQPFPGQAVRVHAPSKYQLCYGSCACCRRSCSQPAASSLACLLSGHKHNR